MSSKIEVSRENRLAYLKAADACIGEKDDALCDALDAAIEAEEDGAADAAELFAAFCALLDAKGVAITSTVKTAAEKADEKGYQDYVQKNPGSNRGKTYR